METCCSINCPFIAFCKEYNNEIDRSEGCKTQLLIIKQVEKYKINSKKVQRRKEHFTEFNNYYICKEGLYDGRRKYS